MSAKNIIKLKKELNIKIIEPFKSDIIEFENVEQFNDYISRDIERYTSLTTQKLNKMFHVPGYRITRMTVTDDDGQYHKEIGLRMHQRKDDGEDPKCFESPAMLKEMLETLINEVNRIDAELNNLKTLRYA